MGAAARRGKADGYRSSLSGGCRGGVRVSGGHLCEAEAPTEATAETSAPPEENEAVTRRVILSLSNPKGAAGGISSAHKTKFSHRWTVISDQWSDGYRSILLDKI